MASGGMLPKRYVANRLPPEVNRILLVKSLPYKISPEEMYDIFGKYGSVYQIRLGLSSNPDTRGRAFVVYDDIHDAKMACEHLNGFNVGGRYIVVLYYQPPASTTSTSGDPAQTKKMTAQESREATEKKTQEVNALKQKYGVKGNE